MEHFTPNTTFLTEKFNEFNATYFDGKLPMVRFIYNHSKRNLGLYNSEFFKLLYLKVVNI